MTKRLRSKLDATSVVLIVAAFTLFLIAAICYTASVIILYVADARPYFTLTEIGNFAGIGGMIVVPLFIVAAVTVNIRDKRRELKEKSSDDNPEQRTAGSS